MSQKRIEKEAGKLLVVCWFVHAETVFESGADDQFIDQRVALAVDLPPLAAFAIDGPTETTDRDAPTRGRSICANDRILVIRGMKFSIYCQHSDRHFQHNGIDVEAGHCVRSVIVG